ncbi:MAG TPA: ABC-type transport auxiliary lipoprotein family protein [Candidatus Didemnitutus sp.]|nr:ABC-type transport auxiliary lipoprotein family protein [Candidatus Didemnitutus sp.]
MKTKSRFAAVAGLPLVAAFLLLGACNLPQPTTDTTRFYVLVVKPDASTAAAATATRKWSVALAPIEVPPFLRSKPMAVRVSPTEVRYIDEARWAEPLDAGILRVFREQLEVMPEFAQVSTGPDIVGAPADFQIVVRVLRCEGDVTSEKMGRFVATVEIHAANGDRLARDTLYAEVGGWDGKDYGVLAGKLSEAVRDLATRVPPLLEKASAAKGG